MAAFCEEGKQITKCLQGVDFAATTVCSTRLVQECPETAELPCAQSPGSSNSQDKFIGMFGLSIQNMDRLAKSMARLQAQESLGVSAATVGSPQGCNEHLALGHIDCHEVPSSRHKGVGHRD